MVWLELDVLTATEADGSPKRFTLTFGEPKDFVGGLVTLVGEPMGHRMLGMRQVVQRSCHRNVTAMSR